MSLVFLPLVCAGNVPQKEYIERFSPIAVSEMQRTGIPASITLAQGLVESAAGQSALAVGANNHFGIKCHSDWTGPKFYQDDDARNECFRVYSSPEESYVAHSDFLTGRKRYQELFTLDPKNYKAWARGLSKAGYATDPKYAAKLIKVIEDYELFRFDGQEVHKESIGNGKSETVTADRNAGQTKETLAVAMTRPVGQMDRARYVESLPGEKLESIAEQYGLFVRELCRYNSFGPDVQLETGTIVYLDKPHRHKR